MRSEFRGENLSDAANAVSSPKKSAVSTPKSTATSPLAATTAPTREIFGLPPHLVGILGKEFLYIRRHTGIVYGLIMPIVVMLFVASKFARPGNVTWIFPALVAYTMLAISNFSYNSFGLESTGSQFYFLAPVRLRDVMLAKNIASFFTAFVEVALIFVVISFAAGVPQLSIALATLFWAAATMMFTTLVGNRRSIVAAKKVATGKMANKQISQLSALISMGILTGSMLIAAIPAGLAFYFHQLWIVLPVAVLYAARRCLLLSTEPALHRPLRPRPSRRTLRRTLQSRLARLHHADHTHHPARHTLFRPMAEVPPPSLCIPRTS